jgi:serine phosphatase RsbU (regulator of sigma subunit)
MARGQFGGFDYDTSGSDGVKIPSALSRVTGTLVLTAFLMVTLAFAVQGAFQTRARIADTFARQARIGQAQIGLEEMLRSQIDAENSLRGYSLTHDPFYIDQYLASIANLDRKADALGSTLVAERLDPASQTLAEYQRVQIAWRSEVATPIMKHPNADVLALDKRDKFFNDYEARLIGVIRATLAETDRALVQSTQQQLDRSSYVRVFWLLVFGLLAVLLNAYRSRLNQELEQERTTTETLQRAFRSEFVPLPNCEIGSAYLAASSHLAVGGDVFDVYRLSDALALVLIADVSGKGVDAAVLTAFIKFTIRGIALRRREPGAILAEFNTAFAQTVENPYLFVSMFVGVLDTSNAQLRYASAGHDSAFLRRSQGVEQLAVTGPVLGVMEEPFDTKTIVFGDGDTLVLATDGLTEARSRNGEQLRERGAMMLISQASADPQKLADELVAQVRALGGDVIRDDLAVLAIRVHDPGAHDGA